MWMVKVIDRGDDRKGTLVSKPGREHSYTHDPRCAQKYPTKEAAQAHCCGNEVPVPLQPYIDELCR